MNRDRRPRGTTQPCCNPADHARLGCVSVDEVWAEAADDPDQRHESAEVVQADLSLEGPDVNGRDAVLVCQVVHVALLGPLRPADQGCVVTPRLESFGEGYHLDGRPPDVEPRDNAEHAHRLVGRAFANALVSPDPHQHYDTSEGRCRAGGGGSGGAVVVPGLADS